MMGFIMYNQIPLFMVWNIIIAVIILVIIALLNKRIKWMVKMLDSWIEQFFIKIGLTTGDFPVSVLKYHPSKKKLTDSDWNIRVQYPEEAIQNCEVRVNGNKLLWRDNKESKNLGYRQYIPKGGGEIIHIPQGDFTEDARVQVWDGNKILKNINFKNLPFVKE